ncbi:MAG TPA: HDIG domain-containing protein, partial [Armatimonadota bacterium]
VDLGRMLSIGALIALLVGFVTFYLREHQPTVHSDFRRMSLLALVVCLTVLGMKIGTTTLGIRLDSVIIGYLGLLWIPAAAMMLSVLLSAHTGGLVATLLAVGTGLSLDLELRYVAATIASSLVGVYVVAHIRDRNGLVRVLLTVCTCNLALVWVLGSFAGDKLETLVLGTFWGLGCGIGAPLLLWLGVALLERPFGITTYLGLLELSDPNRPMLRRLQMEAPGTYHHSMIVGALSEAAAEAIGANSLLCRVMAYYHDIGKMRRPQFFVENQRFENLHDRLNPTLSMLIITSHVRDGVDFAKEVKLPKPIQDGIREHHGTGLVTYFYHQAAVTDRTTQGSVLEQHFRYEGPKPQSKESAVLMLADGCEAASRCLSKPTPGKIEGLVRRIVQERLTDGQLAESDLTFRDIERIIGAFTRTLQGILHARIEYPKVISASEAKRALNAAGHPASLKVTTADHPASEDSGDAAAAL